MNYITIAMINKEKTLNFTIAHLFTSKQMQADIGQIEANSPNLLWNERSNIGTN